MSFRRFAHPHFLHHEYTYGSESDAECFCADLDRAMRKGMEKIGMEAAVPGFDLHEAQAGSHRERQLLQRIAQLEAQLQQT